MDLTQSDPAQFESCATCTASPVGKRPFERWRAPPGIGRATSLPCPASSPTIRRRSYRTALTAASSPWRAGACRRQRSPFRTRRQIRASPTCELKSPHWRRWLTLEHRCVVPFTSFSENEVLPDGSRPPVWFALSDNRPLAFFAGIWTSWTSVRKLKEGETTNDLFAFLTTDPNLEVGAIHPKAMPVILRTPEEIDAWMTATPVMFSRCSGPCRTAR